jgi:hypothetical protein
MNPVMLCVGLRLEDLHTLIGGEPRSGGQL